MDVLKPFIQIYISPVGYEKDSHRTTCYKRWQKRKHNYRISFSLDFNHTLLKSIHLSLSSQILDLYFSYVAYEIIIVYRNVFMWIFVYVYEEYVYNSSWIFYKKIYLVEENLAQSFGSLGLFSSSSCREIRNPSAQLKQDIWLSLWRGFS